MQKERYQLQDLRIGALPILNRFIERMGLEEELRLAVRNAVAVATAGDALERVAWYARREGFEVFQAILERGCRVRQLASQQGI